MALDIPPDLCAVVHRCLDKDAAGRFASVLDLARALTPFAEGDGVARLDRMERVVRNRATTSEELLLEVPSPAHSADRQSTGTSTPSVRAPSKPSQQATLDATKSLSRRRLLGVGLAAGAAAGIAVAAGVFRRAR